MIRIMIAIEIAVIVERAYLFPTSLGRWSKMLSYRFVHSYWNMLHHSICNLVEMKDGYSAIQQDQGVSQYLMPRL
jgi:hypothetical protein